jgi:hypothetical protein
MYTLNEIESMLRGSGGLRQNIVWQPADLVV